MIVTDYDKMSPAQMARELKRQGAELKRQDKDNARLTRENKRQGAELKKNAKERRQERSSWRTKEGWENRHSDPDMAHRKETLHAIISNPARLRSATGCSPEEFEFILYFFTMYIRAHERLLPLFRIEGGSRHSDPGNRCALEPEYALLLALMRKKTNLSQEVLAGLFGVDQSNISRYLKTLDRILLAVLPIADKIEEMIINGTIDAKRAVPAGTILLDCTEVPIMSPGDREAWKMTSSGKKGMNTFSTMLATNTDGIIMHESESYAGSHHDFTIYKKGSKYVTALTDALQDDLPNGPTLCADLGFLGLAKRAGPGVNVVLPRKTPKCGQLTDADRAWNRRVAKKRNEVERTFGYLKTYGRMRGPYDSDIERFRDELSVTTGLTNLHIMWRKRLRRIVRRGEPPPHWSAYFE